MIKSIISTGYQFLKAGIWIGKLVKIGGISKEDSASKMNFCASNNKWYVKR
jgi:hypothetical protein